MAKQIKFDAEARQKILAGVEKLSNAVTSTLGPSGRNVILDKKFGSPQITKDGVTVAKEIELPDPFENMGAQMVKEVASKTNDVAVTAPRPRPSSPRRSTARDSRTSPRVRTAWPSSAASTRLRPPSSKASPSFRRR